MLVARERHHLSAELPSCTCCEQVIFSRMVTSPRIEVAIVIGVDRAAGIMAPELSRRRTWTCRDKLPSCCPRPQTPHSAYRNKETWSSTHRPSEDTATLVALCLQDTDLTATILRTPQ